MIARVHRGSAGFGGVVDSLLAARTRPPPHPIPDEPAAPSHARVVWTDTRNLPTFDPRRAGRVMRATAAAAPELKRLAGVPPGGRPLLRPVYHLTLCWAVTDSPSRVEMERAADEALRALGLEERQGGACCPQSPAAAPAHRSEPGASGDRQSGRPRPRPAHALEVGRRLRAGAGRDPLRRPRQAQPATGPGAVAATKQSTGPMASPPAQGTSRRRQAAHRPPGAAPRPANSAAWTPSKMRRGAATRPPAPRRCVSSRTPTTARGAGSSTARSEPGRTSTGQGIPSPAGSDSGAPPAGAGRTYRPPSAGSRNCWGAGNGNSPSSKPSNAACSPAMKPPGRVASSRRWGEPTSAPPACKWNRPPPKSGPAASEPAGRPR